MAIYNSPGVFSREIDLTASVSQSVTSAAGFVAPMAWGPILDITLTDSEDTLIKRFGKPNASNNQYWLSASSFLAYSSSLYMVRAASTGFLNAIVDVAGNTATAVQIKNDQDWEDNYSAGEAAVGEFAARYAGSLGNSLFISIADSATFTGWDYEALFDSAPATSDYAEARGGSNDEMHIVIVDEDGLFTGVPGTVLEQYAYVSKGSDARYNDGTPSYYKQVLNTSSAYVHWMDHITATNIGTSVVNKAFGDLAAVYEKSFVKGADDYAGTGDGELQAGYALFSSVEEADISMIFVGPASVPVAQYVIDNIAEVRRDLVVTFSPKLASVRGADKAEDVVADKNDSGTGINRSTSYGVFDGNWKLMFDRYNEVNVWVPCNADVAGLMARVDVDRDPWWSPAGLERGTLKNVIKLAWNPSKTERDILYKAGVNPIVSMPGQGPLLYGDKTMLSRSSAFDRINVRRLFIVLEKAISRASESTLFEFNDEFTRASFINLVVPYLRNVQGRRGLTDFKVICDETNNTPEVIDANQFVGSIFIKPARSINFVQLSFVATRTGVEFSEVVGAV